MWDETSLTAICDAVSASEPVHLRADRLTDRRGEIRSPGVKPLVKRELLREGAS